MIHSGKIVAVIPAGGSGSRMGRTVPKQFLKIHGCPIFIHTLKKFDLCQAVDEVILVVPAGSVDQVGSQMHKWNVQKTNRVVAGGVERQDSVWKGLEVLSGDTKIILVHDAVRPCVSPGLIQKIILTAMEHGAAVPVVPERHTLKKGKEGWVEETLDRNNLWQVQTPQGFRADWLRRGYELAQTDGFIATDDASLVERAGYRVHMIDGEEKNIKITSSDDLILSRMFLRMETK